MSIEENIKRIADALEGILTYVAKDPDTREITDTEPVAPPPVEKPKRTRKKKVRDTVTPVVTEELTPPETDDSTPPEPDEPSHSDINVEDLITVGTEIIKSDAFDRNGEKTVMALLGKYGAGKMSDVKSEDIAYMYAEMKNALEGLTHG